MPGLQFSCLGSKNRLLSKLEFTLLSFIYVLGNRPLLIICGHSNLSVLGLFFYRLFRIKYILLTHGLDIWDIKSSLRRLALREASIIIAVSSYSVSKIREQIGQGNRRIFIIPGPVDPAIFTPSPRPEHLVKKYGLQGHKVILTVSRLSSSEDKGYDRVIRALPDVMQASNKVKYLIVGTGDDIPRIKRLVKELNLEGQVIFAGFIPQEELPQYYNLCDLFVLPSKQEGLGIVFLEALASGKPVIAGNQDGSKEALLNGKLGLLVDPDDIAQIAQAITRILKGNVDPSIVDGRLLRELVIQNFGIKSFYHKVSEAVTYIDNQLLAKGN